MGKYILIYNASMQPRMHCKNLDGQDIHTTLVKCLNLAINNLTSMFSFLILNAYFSTMVEDSQVLCSSSLAFAWKTKFPLPVFI